MKIRSISIEHKMDYDPDLSYLGKYQNKYENGAIDRQTIGDQARNEYRYFMPGNRHGGFEDYKRYEKYNRGSWYVIGIITKAEISIVVGKKLINTTIQSGGLWGIESDREDEYIEEIEQEELADLRYQLSEMGFGMIQLDKAFENMIERKDEFNDQNIHR